MTGKAKLFGNNPLLRLGLGLCPALAVTTTAANALGMGVATACVLLLTCAVTGLVGGLIDRRARLAVTLIISAGFATLMQMVLRSWFPALNEALGVFVPLTAVSSLILCHADAEDGLGAALAGGAAMGVGYILAMTLLGVVRELLGRGTVFGASVFPAGYEPFLLAMLPAGGLLITGLAAGVYRAVACRGNREKEGA